jgi:hypothetical protein
MASSSTQSNYRLGFPNTVDYIMYYFRLVRRLQANTGSHKDFQGIPVSVKQLLLCREVFTTSPMKSFPLYREYAGANCVDGIGAGRYTACDLSA